MSAKFRECAAKFVTTLREDLNVPVLIIINWILTAEDAVLLRVGKQLCYPG